ncbi:MAG: hypothetical protein RL007_709 [Bacteroidota bacterium]|jgi:hypothetical protein
MIRRCAILFCFLLTVAAVAQTDSVAYSQGFAFSEGVYLNFSQFRSNKPIPKSRIVLDGDTTRPDILKQTLSKTTFQWRDTNGVIQTTKVSTVWGYSENKTVYTLLNAQFNRIVVIGSICHFTSYVTDYRYTGPGTYPNQQYGVPVETLQQYILDVDSGQFYVFQVSSMEYVLQRDPLLYAEYAALKKKQKRDQMFIYLRKYNEKHPLMFPR